MILIGTSGYDHPELKGIFYPEKLARKDFLSYYATVFNSLELNSTFYGMPDKARMESFYERTSGKLSFSIKANRLLTHEIQKNWKDDASDFRNALSVLQEKGVLASILFQFPESFHYTPENRLYLSALLHQFDCFPKVVEFRHREWIRSSVFDGLMTHHAGIVFCDMPPLRNLPDGKTLGTPFLGKNAYIRFHGRNAGGWYVNADSSSETPRYDYNYSESELLAFVPVVKMAEGEGRTVQLYFNNHPKGNGIQNAILMKKLLDVSSLREKFINRKTGT